MIGLNIMELKGKLINTSILRNIYDTYILLAEPKDAIDEKGFHTLEGTVVFIGEKQDSEYEEAYKKYTINNICPAVFIQRKEEFSEGVYYE